MSRETASVHTCKVERRCWTYANHLLDEYLPAEQQCRRLIAVGEKYVRSTVFPGHDSGYADDRLKYVDGQWVPVPPSPVSSEFCIPCGRRWRNLVKALERKGVEI